MYAISKICRLARTVLLSLCCLMFPIFQATPQEMLTQPLVQVTDLDGTTGLVGWRRAPVTYAENRIVPIAARYSEARVLSIQSDLPDLQTALVESLKKDGVTSFRLSARRELSGEIVTSFMDATGMKTSTFYAWVGSARSAGEPVKVAGFSITTPSGSDRGTSAEMFIAPPDSFVALGGWVVPTVRYFGLQLYDPNADMAVYGAMSDQDATEEMGRFFKEWMAYITRGQNMATIGTLQTLGIQNGTDQSQDTGLQDPIFD